ncbi:energy transducer TonB [Mycetohabitans endofungorum]|uniref:energy transducer TonB n=1 Tax=Mycetohabitans endofungorum TaxID=417203 RepID=UPI002B05A50F|nr:TonB family protein [Mycetohabitans endofungorum]
MKSRAVAHYTTTLAVVALLHAGVIAWLVYGRADTVPTVTVESRPIMAELLAPPAPVAVQSTPTPAPKPKSVVMPRPSPKPIVKNPAPAPTPPMPVRDTPSQSVPTPPASPAAPAPAPVAEPASPAPSSHSVVAQGAPKGVAKLDCQIVRPDYPALSRRREETGTVIVNLVVGLDGKVERATIKKSSGYDRLDAAARNAALASTCRPYIENGQPIRVTADQPYVFNLGD